MGDKKKQIVVCDEMVANLKHCLKRTEHMWEYGLDMWPFDIQHIIKEYEEADEL